MAGTYTNFPHGDEQQLPFDGADNLEMPDVTNPQDTIPLPTPNTWVNQQLAQGIGLDLSTPSLDDLNNAAFNWGNSTIPTYPEMTATPEVQTSSLPYPPIQSQTLYHTHELPSNTNKLDGSSAYSPYQSAARSQSQESGTASGLNATLAQSPMFSARGLTGLRSVRSAVNMAATYTGVPSRPQSSGGGGTQSASRSQTDHNSHDEDQSDSEEAGEDTTRKVHKERNRIAAAKTRRKKKSKAKEIEEHAQQIEETNTRLHQEVRSLRDTFSTLRYCALSHDPTAGCTCVGIHQYNAHMANEVAKEVAKKL